MPRNPELTRTSIMDAAEELVLDYGFSGTTVDAVIERAGVTKGAFFHHFPTKTDLGHAIVERYAALDARHLEETMARAERLSRDPLQQLLIFVGLFEEEMAELTDSNPGCLFASYCYQAELFDRETLEIAREAFWRWRDRVLTKLKEIEEKYPPRLDVDLTSLADMLMAVFEGAFILSRTLSDQSVAAPQLGHYRRYLELLYSPDGPQQAFSIPDNRKT